ncbi:PAS domain S-box protein, partial [Planktothrix sp. FACHB-1355]|nr:PAS domain S-box protein [Planktothrix sp. FACHB-1355]
MENSRAELLAMSVADIISSDAIDPKVSVRDLLRQKHIVVESLHITKDGQTIPVEVSATLFTLNNLPTVQAICRDISKRKQAEKERDQLLARERAAREEAEAANRIKDEFLAVLSHELRSPLNPILGWARLLQKRKFDDETTARALETIERNAKLQTQLIEDLLDVSRILRGKLVLNVAAVNLITTIAAALETVQLAAEAKGIQIQTFLSANAGQVSGDATRLQQVVWNLLSNAVKFTPAGGRIEVCFQPDGNYAEITVSDTGKGISREFLPYVFEYFRQEDGQVRTLPPDRGGEIPAIALTAYAGELNRQQALEAGFGRHISKPVEPEELVQAIAELGARGSGG